MGEFQQAAALAPEMPFVHFAIGYLYWEQRQFEKAEAEFRRETRPPNGDVDQANGYLADIAFRSDTHSAESLLRSASASDPSVRIAQYDLGILCSEQNRPA